MQPLCPCAPSSASPFSRDIARYKNFLGLNNPDDWMAAAKEMKSKPDFTSAAWDTEAIAQVRAAKGSTERQEALTVALGKRVLHGGVGSAMG
jgi:hypothetical protein